MDFTNRLSFIFGGSLGIGLAAARLLLDKGSRVVLFSRHNDNLQNASASLVGNPEGDESGKCRTVVLDVTDRESVQTVLKKTIDLRGVPDLVVNCVGMAVPKHFEDISYSQFDDIMKSNVYSVWNTLSVLLPAMKYKGGHIVNCSSIAGFIGVIGYPDYSAAKFGVIGLTQALRMEYRIHNIRFSVLCPPDTDTPGYREELKTKPEDTRLVTSMSRIRTPESVAEAMLQGVADGRFMIIPGFSGKIGRVLSRYLPGVVFRYMCRRIRAIQMKDTQCLKTSV